MPHQGLGGLRAVAVFSEAFHQNARGLQGEHHDSIAGYLDLHCSQRGPGGDQVAVTSDRSDSPGADQNFVVPLPYVGGHSHQKAPATFLRFGR